MLLHQPGLTEARRNESQASRIRTPCSCRSLSLSKCPDYRKLESREFRGWRIVAGRHGKRYRAMVDSTSGEEAVLGIWLPAGVYLFLSWGLLASDLESLRRVVSWFVLHSGWGSITNITKEILWKIYCPNCQTWKPVFTTHLSPTTCLEEQPQGKHRVKCYLWKEQGYTVMKRTTAF